MTSRHGPFIVPETGALSVKTVDTKHHQGRTGGGRGGTSSGPGLRGGMLLRGVPTMGARYWGVYEGLRSGSSCYVFSMVDVSTRDLTSFARAWDVRGPGLPSSLPRKTAVGQVTEKAKHSPSPT